MARAAKDKKIKIAETLEIDCSTPKSSGSAIYLLKKVLLFCLEKEESLSTLDLIVYSLSQVKYSGEVGEFLEEKTRLVFSEQEGNVDMRKAIDGLENWM